MQSPEFRDIASKWGDFVHHFTRSALAFRTTEGDWVLQYGFVAFSPEPIVTIPISIETKSLLVLRDGGSLDGLTYPAVEATLADPCRIQIGGHSLQLPSAGDTAQETYHALHLPRFPGSQRLPSISVSRQGGISTSPPTLPNPLTIDLELKAHPHPYESLAELIAEIGNPIAAHEIGASAIPRVEIVLAPPARITRGEIKDGILQIDVTTSACINQSKLAFGLRLFSTKGTPIQHVPFTGTAAWEDTDTLSIGYFQEAVPEIGLANIFMTYDGEFLGSWWARDQSVAFSSRATLHKAIDTDNAFVAKFFDDRNAFEEHVLGLLFLLKLDCLYYGKMAELKDGPDILASSDQGHLYVIECTTGDINNKGKLRRLYERTNNIRAALANSAHRPREILPVMITSSTKSETLHCVDELAAYQIAIVCREDISGLFSQIEAPPTADRLYAATVGTIPTVSGLPFKT
jgi:hypothetical protein